MPKYSIAELQEGIKVVDTKFEEFYSACEELIGADPHCNVSITQELDDCEKFNFKVINGIVEKVTALQHANDSVTSNDSYVSKGKIEQAGAECNNGVGQLNPSQLDNEWKGKEQQLQQYLNTQGNNQPQTHAEVKAQPVKKEEYSQPFNLDEVKEVLYKSVDRIVDMLPSKELNPNAKVFSPSVHFQESDTHVNNSGNQSSGTDNNVRYITQPSVGQVSLDAMQRIADIMSANQTRENLPRPEPEVFKGDMLVFINWLKGFTFIPSYRMNWLKGLHLYAMYLKYSLSQELLI